MRDLIITLSLLSATFTLTSCGGLKSKRTQSAEPSVVVVEELPQVPQEPTIPAELRVYSNAFDGFVNIREQPSAKSAVIGILRNGEQCLERVKLLDKWVAVKYHDQVGYIIKSAVGSTPCPAVDIDVDGDWLQGVYSTGYYAYLIYNNGSYAFVHQYGTVSYGTYMLDGHDIVLTTRALTEYGKDGFDNISIGYTERLAINVELHSIDNIKREELHPESYYKTDDEDEDYGGEMIITTEEFQIIRKQTRQAVNL